MTAVLLAARFVLEVALLAGLAIGGWALPEAEWAKVLLAVALPVAAAALWGLLLSPKARLITPLPLRLVIEVLLFGSAALALWVADRTAFAVVLLTLEAVVLISLLASGHPPGPPRPQPFPTSSRRADGETAG